jgi:hypothetical protein
MARKRVQQIKQSLGSYRVNGHMMMMNYQNPADGSMPLNYDNPDVIVFNIQTLYSCIVNQRAVGRF